MVVYLPIFALTGVEGRMFHPMALTVVLALLGAMILSVTFVPAAVALFMGNKVAEKENRLMSWAKRRYEPLLDMALRRTPRVLIAATVFMVACGVLASRMGSEFIPSLNEGDMAIQALRIPGTSLSQSLEMQKQLEVRLKRNSRDRTDLRAHRHGRDRLGPDAAEHLRRLHHAQAHGSMAEAAQDPCRAAGRHPGGSGQDAGQQL